MAQNRTILQEDTRSPIDGTEYVRLATTGANWKATLSAIASALVTVITPGGSGTEIQYRAGTSFGGATGTSWTDATRALAIASGSITTTRFVLEAGSINAQVGVNYQLQASDNGKIITLTNALPITLTCPAGLGAAFSCVILQGDVGQVGIVAGVGATLNSYLGLVHLGGQYAMANIIAPTANNFVLSGQTA